jgi:hypothetical protein
LARLESEQKFEDEQICHARKKGLLGAKESVSGTLSLYKHRVPQLWPSRLLIPIWFGWFRERYLLAITDHRVVLLRIAAAGFRGAQGGAYSTLPCALQMLKAAKPPRYFLDNKVALPSDLAEFAGQRYLYASSDVKAESIIKLASSNGSYVTHNIEPIASPRHHTDDARHPL